MILAVPLVVIARIVCDNHDHPYAKTFVRLLAGNLFDSKEEFDSVTTRPAVQAGHNRFVLFLVK